MFLKQGAYKPRQNSQGAAAAGSESSPAADNSGSAATNAAVAGRRRSSAADKFAGLTQTKRSSQDTGAASFADQKPGNPGVLGGLWNSFTKGT